MKCPFCETIIQDYALFCTNCGKKLPEDSKEAEFPAEVKLQAEEDDELSAAIEAHLRKRREQLSDALTENAALKAEKEALMQELAESRNLREELAAKNERIITLQNELDMAQRLIGKQEQEKSEMLDRIKELEPLISEEEGALEADMIDEPTVPESIEEIEAALTETETTGLPTELLPENVPGEDELSQETEICESDSKSDSQADKICPNCGTAMPFVNKFCTRCGTKLE